MSGSATPLAPATPAPLLSLKPGLRLSRIVRILSSFRLLLNLHFPPRRSLLSHSGNAFPIAPELVSSPAFLFPQRVPLPARHMAAAAAREPRRSPKHRAKPPHETPHETPRETPHEKHPTKDNTKHPMNNIPRHPTKHHMKHHSGATSSCSPARAPAGHRGRPTSGSTTRAASASARSARTRGNRIGRSSRGRPALPTILRVPMPAGGRGGSAALGAAECASRRGDSALRVLRGDARRVRRRARRRVRPAPTIFPKKNSICAAGPSHATCWRTLASGVASGTRPPPCTTWPLRTRVLASRPREWRRPLAHRERARRAHCLLRVQPFRPAARLGASRPHVL